MLKFSPFRKFGTIIADQISLAATAFKHTANLACLLLNATAYFSAVVLRSS